jgi:hypothetical protein
LREFGLKKIEVVCGGAHGEDLMQSAGGAGGGRFAARPARWLLVMDAGCFVRVVCCVFSG